VTTIAYQFGRDKPPVYALEGSVAVAGSAMKWLTENMGMIKDPKESEIVSNGW
jgi:glycerol kinase